jgi:hypothetical protein
MMIERSTQRIMGIGAITETVSRNPLIKSRKDRSGDLLMQKSGVKSITPHDTI